MYLLTRLVCRFKECVYWSKECVNNPLKHCGGVFDRDHLCNPPYFRGRKSHFMSQAPEPHTHCLPPAVAQSGKPCVNVTEAGSWLVLLACEGQAQ